MRNWIIAAAALVVAAPASAQVTLEPGQGVTVRLAKKGDVSVSDVRADELGKYDMSFVEKMRTSAPTGNNIVMGSAAPNIPVPKVQPDRVEITFVVLDGKESVMVLVNGYGEAVSYRASIWRRGRKAPTDVCIVLPGKRGYEHWPYPIERIELTAFTAVPWKDGDPIPCV